MHCRVQLQKVTVGDDAEQFNDHLMYSPKASGSNFFDTVEYEENIPWVQHNRSAYFRQSIVTEKNVGLSVKMLI